MPTEILMPALSPTMEKGKLAKWLVKEGDTVTSGDIIAEIETDKATMEVEAVDEGKIGKILIAEGTDDVPVNTTIAVLLEDGETADDITASASAAATPPAPAASADLLRHPQSLRHRKASRGCICTSSGPGGGCAGPPARRPYLCVTAGAAHRQTEQYRHHAVVGNRPAWPHHQAGCGNRTQGWRAGGPGTREQSTWWCRTGTCHGIRSV